MDAKPFSDDFYERLGVAPDATTKEIKAAYIEIVKGLHPDRQQGLLSAHFDHMTRNLNEAHDTLKNPTERRKYDEDRAAKTQRQQREDEERRAREARERKRREDEERRAQEARDRKRREEEERRAREARDRQQREDEERRAREARERKRREDEEHLRIQQRADNAAVKGEFVLKPGRIFRVYNHPEGHIRTALWASKLLDGELCIWLYPLDDLRLLSGPLYYELWKFPPGRWTVPHNQANRPLPVRFSLRGKRVLGQWLSLADPSSWRDAEYRDDSPKWWQSLAKELGAVLLEELEKSAQKKAASDSKESGPNPRKPE
jgi:curved DNA-binding protein CbpA